MYHTFWVGFATYMGDRARNKMMVNFPQVNETDSKKAFVSS